MKLYPRASPRIYPYFKALHKRHVESLVSAYADMGADLLKEKRALTTMWHKRDKQLERVTASITGLCADLQTIAGAGVLPEELAPLELAGMLDESSRATTNGQHHHQAVHM